MFIMDTHRTGHTREPIFLPIAGGKGGVGKSLVAANLSISLSKLGFHTIAADLDLGGSNLHSFLGMTNKYPGIGEFIKAESGELSGLLVASPFNGLRFLPGDGVAPFTANITFHQKQRFINELKKLSADFIILDLGAGSSFNVLDFFSLSNRGLLITTPDFPAILTMMSFLKNLLFRNFENTFKKDSRLRQLMNRLFYQPLGDRQLTVGNIAQEGRRVSPEAEKTLNSICASIRPRVIFNMGQDPDELNLIKQFSRGLKTVLSLEAEYLGFIFQDQWAIEAVKRRQPLMRLAPQSLAAREIFQLARRLVKFRNGRVENSAQLLVDSTRRFYNKYADPADSGNVDGS